MRRPTLIAFILLSAAGAVACKPRPIPPNVTPPQAETPAQPAEPAAPATPAQPDTPPAPAQP